MTLTKKVKIVLDERVSWKYGVPDLAGTAFLIYTIYNKNLIQLLDIVEIYNENTNEFYVECCFAIDNMRIKNKEYDMLYDLYKVDINTLNSYEFVFWDSLIAFCQLFSEDITLPKWKEDYQRSHIFKRYIKYMLFCNEKIIKTEKQIDEYICIFLKKKGIYEKEKYLELNNIIQKVKLNMLKSFEKYCRKYPSENENVIKHKYGIIEIND